jgi:3-keto-5-aminohexanoate cleavage enzyme
MPLYGRLLADDLPDIPGWSKACVDILQLIGSAVSRGGHLRVGLENAPWRTSQTNRQRAEQAASGIRKACDGSSSAKDVHAALAAMPCAAPEPRL